MKQWVRWSGEGSFLFSGGYFREDQLSEVIIADIVLSCKRHTDNPEPDGLAMVKQQGAKGSQSPDAIRGVLTRVNQRGWRDLKILSVERGITLNALAVEAFNDVLKKYGKRASVENPLIT